MDDVSPDATDTETGKVFGIGFHKTGTTSLGAALEHLGYRVCHGARVLRTLFGDHRTRRMLETNQLDLVRVIAGRFDAFRDQPWYVLYRELDHWFPNSKFILTTRDEGAWIESVVRHFGSREYELARWIYGEPSPIGDEARFVERYRRHAREVREYFADRPGDLLVVDWERGDGWSELAGFLRRPHPERPFPWENASRPEQASHT